MNEPRGGMRVHPSKMGHSYLEHAGGEFFFLEHLPAEPHVSRPRFEKG